MNDLGKGPQIRIGLALSGGGFRASAFHLGVLKRLEEFGILCRIEMLSCVSGGSLTGSLYALRCAQSGRGAPGAFSVDALIAELYPVVTENLRARALFGNPLRGLQALASVVSPRISRIGLMVAELDRQLYKGATLDMLPSWIVINATNLRTGKAWKFFDTRAGDYLTGATDKTSKIRIAQAVAASAAYPLLTDSYAFVTRWEDLRADLLTGDRWERVAQGRPGGVSPWRERYGKAKGTVVFPLVDGGLYDNEGANGLRGSKVTHAILSGVTAPESDHQAGFGFRRLLRLVEVMHSRLGAATRQLTHEMTHGVSPRDAEIAADSLASDLQNLSESEELPQSLRARLAGFARRAKAIRAVGIPRRGPQFAASAQILLHRKELAENAFASDEAGPIDVPPQFRGLDPSLVAELSRVRTDFDALEPDVVELLIAQGYFLTDLFVKQGMPGLVSADSESDWYADKLAPLWPRAHTAVKAANTNQAATVARLKTAAEIQVLIGRVANVRQWLVFRFVMLLVAGIAVAIVAFLSRSANLLVSMISKWF
ncbi:MAG: patatin-like phospholipase family protein [Gemmatimonadaceae bacterium]